MRGMVMGFPFSIGPVVNACCALNSALQFSSRINTFSNLKLFIFHCVHLFFLWYALFIKYYRHDHFGHWSVSSFKVFSFLSVPAEKNKRKFVHMS